MNPRAAIVAGGRGSRMRGVSDIPKPMLPLGGKPVLEHQIVLLKKSGFDRIFMCLGFGAKVVEEHFGDGSRWGVGLDYQVETTPRGTAGCVRDLGKKAGTDLLVVYGDLYIEMDLKALLNFHQGHDAAATLVIRRTDHPKDSDLVELEPGGRIRAIGRLDSGKVSGDLGCAAVWVVRPQLMEFADAAGLCDFGRDVFPKALAAGETLMGYRTEEVVADIGTTQRYEAFRKRFQTA